MAYIDSTCLSPIHPTPAHTITSMSAPQNLDVLVVGGGFAGVYHLYRLREMGHNVKLFDAAPDFGGIWRLNCYPGARVDSELPLYGLSFPQVYRTWNWSERYPSFKELRAYFDHMAQVLDLRKDCAFNMRVTKAHWNEDKGVWDITAGPQGQEQHVTAKHVIFCLGFASKLNFPAVQGLDKYKGQIRHSGDWPEGLEAEHFKGKKVAVVGSGASGVQITQEIGPHVKEMSVFIRTPNLCLPMNNVKTTPESQEIFKDAYPDIFQKRWKTFAGFHYDFDYQPWDRHTPEEREAFYEEIWARKGFHFWLETYVDVYFKKDCNRTAYDFWQKKTAPRIKNQAKRDFLVPKEWPHTFGTVRPSLETSYFEVLDQDNVTVVNAKADPIESFTEKGIRLKSGKEEEFDFIALATGFDTHTGGFKNIDIRGENGLPLSDKWKQGCNSYLGLTTHGFPNMFFLYGPHGPTAYTNGPSTVEIQAEWVTKCIDHLLTKNIKAIRPQRKAEEDFTQHIDDLSAATLFHESHGWYMGRNVPGKPAQALNFTGGIPLYVKELDECAEAGYKGFDLA